MILQPFRNLSIQRKVVSVLLATGLLASILVSVVVTAIQQATADHHLKNVLHAQAHVVAANCRAALVFEDRQAADELLHALGGEPSLSCAALFRTNGQMFAHYGTADHADTLPPGIIEEGFQIDGRDLVLYHPVEMDGRQLGMLQLRYDTRRIHSNLVGTFAATLAGVSLAALAATLLMAMALQTTVALPILRLAAIARTIAEKQDFSLRAPDAGQDEVGTLTDAFNGMLTRIQAQDSALRDSESRYRLLFENSPMPVFAYDATSLAILDANQAAVREYGYSLERLRSMRFPDLCEPGTVAPLAQFFLAPSPTVSGTFELQHRRADGDHLDVQVASHAVEMSGRPARLALCIDVTDRKRAEELARQTRTKLESMVRERTLELEMAKGAAESASAAKSGFLAMMSHEIRTPLNGVIGMLRLLPTQDLTPRQHRWIHMAQTSAQSLLTIINDILDFSKIEAGKLELHPETIDLPALLQELSRAWGYRAKDKGIAWRLHLHPSLPTSVRVDPNRLTQILVNLFSNAIKYTDAGGIDIRVFPGHSASGQTQVRFEVIDTGVGIPAEHQARLFQPFTQVDNSATRRHGGTGLGLGICKQLVQLMEGQIGLTSAPGQGSTFWFQLPLPTCALAVLGAAPVQSLPAPRLNGRVLLAEDNDVNRELAVELIRLTGCTCDVVPNGRGAVPAALGGQYDLIFMDCMMPDMDGYAATRAIRAAERASTARPHPRIPIIAMTANALEGDREACLNAGMDDYLTKPLDPVAIDEVLRRWLPTVPPTPPAGSTSPTEAMP